MNTFTEKRPVHWFIAGDSTAAQYHPNKLPMAGWGQMLYKFLDDRVVVRNYALCGRSSKSFVDQGHLQQIANHIRPGDVLFIQFGHNDQKQDPKRYTDPQSTYAEYITKCIECALNSDAQPVLLTSVERRKFDEDGRLAAAEHGAYQQTTRELAERWKLPLIDLAVHTRKLYESLGIEDSKKLFVWLEAGEHPNYPEGVQDNTHFNIYGAETIARFVADDLNKMNGPLSQYVTYSPQQ
ncbi:rhamnogalacturonan acetylesterase [Marinicrinis lubricantis]|uniref:Rhamnogalacturonan acetylesterase n=1 Tax=Marinicrinis lubricantis TaxID=2086470 RepID=A0ABW1IPW5_9BACL